MRSEREQRGFTLIELLVVVAIMGLLASVVLSSLAVAREKARDAQRKVQVNQFVKALQIYFTTYGNYPCAGTTCTTSVNFFRQGAFGAQALITAGAISAIPNDPYYTSGAACNGPDVGYCYCSSGGDSYVLTVNTENDKGGTDRCYIREGSSAATLCVGHQNSYATEACTNRF